MNGDPMLFVREDEVDAAWRVVDPILRGPSPVYGYAAGTWGPAEASRLIGEDEEWHVPTEERGSLREERDRLAVPH